MHTTTRLSRILGERNLYRHFSQYQPGQPLRYPERPAVPPRSKVHHYDAETHERWLRAMKEMKMKRNLDKSAFIEHKKTIRDLMEIGHVPSHFFYTHDYVLEQLPPLSENTSVVQLTERQLERMTDITNDQGVMAVFDRAKELPKTTRMPLIIWLDRIRNAGNAGAIIRAAAGASCLSVIFSPESCNIWCPATLRASAGAHYMIPTYQNMSLEEVCRSLPENWQICLLQTEKSCRGSPGNLPASPYHAMQLTQPTLMVVGGEATGITEDVMRLIEGFKGDVTNIFIPIIHPLDSLNVGMASSILIYEMMKQYGSIKLSSEGQEVLRASEIARQHCRLGTARGVSTEVSDLVPELEKIFPPHKEGDEEETDLEPINFN